MKKSFLKKVVFHNSMSGCALPPKVPYSSVQDENNWSHYGIPEWGDEKESLDEASAWWNFEKLERFTEPTKFKPIAGSKPGLIGA